MRILVTGAGGFVGRAFIRLVEGKHDVVAIDRNCGTSSGVRWVEGDISDPRARAEAVGDGVDAVVHLATVPGGAAEQDPALAWAINMDASAALVGLAARAGTRPRIIFASSIAVFGDPMPESVDDETPLRPRMVYGAHKAMFEQWLATLARRGEIEALSLRLSGVVARPRGVSGMKSAFMSEIFHALSRGQPFVCPVAADAPTWLTSVSRVAASLRHALAVPVAALGEPYAITLPAVRATLGSLAAEIARQADKEPSVRYEPDTTLQAAFANFPPLQTPRAEALGFAADDGLPGLVAAALRDIARKEG